MWDTYRRHYGPDGDPLILVAQGASRDLNPSLSQSVVDRALERDYPAAAAEYLAQFRSDVEALIAPEAVEACVSLGVRERPRIGKVRYVGFVDPSGGSADSFTCAVAHKEGQRVVLDAVRERKPPFSPDDVVKEYAALLKSYGCYQAHGDRYGGEWPRERFRAHGIGYRVADKPKSELYLSFLPLLNAGRVDLLDLPRLHAQLTGLERRTSRGGRESVDHAPGGHDDLANAAAGAVVTAHTKVGRSMVDFCNADDAHTWSPEEVWRRGFLEANPRYRWAVR